MSAVRLAGVRTSWRTLDDGDFFCPGCGGDRRFRRRTGRRRLVLLGVPVLPRGTAGPVLECAVCRGHFGPEALDHPTSDRLAAMLRHAVHTIVLAVLGAGGAEAGAAREVAVESVRAIGFPDFTEDQLLALLLAVSADSSVSMEIELHEALVPLAPHLAPGGRESLLLRGARVALADGLYGAGEREVLASVGRSLGMDAEDVDRLLAAARTPS
ncbi:TerB family tellurite resistance protein [Streptomyces sp. AJS327]|nr:TerB family tellurite resistance protein [Streptomyces sp. AJS327]MBA0049903.1 TerB family tellurite resistance protein [Streptomyces sp. AJS327]